MGFLKSVSTIAGIFYVASNEAILNSEIYITVFFFMEKVVYTLYTVSILPTVPRYMK